MENASKALIIAGAILLSISIIGIGMLVFNQAKEAISGTGLNSEKASAYNGTFVSYEGTQRGDSVKTLIQLVQDHNLTNTDDPTKQIAVQMGSAAGITEPPSAAVTVQDVNSVKTQIKSGYTYTVDFGYDANTGYIVAVGITQKK